MKWAYILSGPLHGILFACRLNGSHSALRDKIERADDIWPSARDEKQTVHPRSQAAEYVRAFADIPLHPNIDDAAAISALTLADTEHSDTRTATQGRSFDGAGRGSGSFARATRAFLYSFTRSGYCR